MGTISTKDRSNRDKSIKLLDNVKKNQKNKSNQQNSERFWLYSGKMQVQQPLTSSCQDQRQEQMMLAQKLSSPYFPTNSCVLRLNHLFETQTKYPLPQGDQYYSVHDKMLISELHEKWYNNNIIFDEQNNNTLDKYLLAYNLDFQLDLRDTIADLKKKVQMEKFDPDLVIRVYYYQDSPFREDQNSSFKYQQYEAINMSSIETAFKFRSTNPTNSCYFYITTLLKTKISQLKKYLQTYLKESKQIQYKNLDKPSPYRLKIKKDGIKPQKLTKIYQALQSQKFPFSKNEKQLDFTNLNNLEIREICPPGDIIFIEFEDEESIQVSKEKNKQKDKSLRIVCYERADSKKEISSSKIIEKKVIQRLFSEIKNIKVSTLLHEEKIQDAILTSVSCLEMTIKPDDKFEKFQNLIKTSNKDILQLYTFPENFLYYKTLNELSSIEMEQIIEILRDKNVFTEKDRKMCISKRDSNRQKVENPAFQDEEFLDPIVLYTSPYIYPFFNSSLRGNSISLVQKQKIINTIQDHWYYPFSEKLLKSLNKLPNYNGHKKLYRGSVKWNYNYSVDQIIEWSNFISTSKEFEISAKFISNQLTNANSSKTSELTYIFEIDAYSGKDIEQFSYFPREKEVLLLPYSKFKVISQGPATLLKEKIEVTWVRLVEIPIPKKIPGDIVVWIDANIIENSKAFNKIIEVNGFTNCDLVQLVSNEHFEMWLQEFKDTLTIPGVNVHFISNMNRTPELKKEGLKTLEIIRDFNETATVIFYIGNVAKIREVLMNYWTEKQMEPDMNIEVVQNLKSLNSVFQRIINKPST